MKVILPDDHKDITLKQYQEWEILRQRTDLSTFEFNQRKIKVFTGLSYQVVEKVQQSDYEEFLTMIDEALEKTCEFAPKFKIGEIEFGFIPNFDEMQSKEYFDLMEIQTGTETLHQLMAILFRPITAEVKNNGYEIENYEGTSKYEELMKSMPLYIVQGALVFFWNLAEELLTFTLKSMEQEQAKEALQKSILKSGGGMLPSTDLQTEKHGTMST